MAGGNLNPNSQNDVVTTVSHMLSEFETFVQTEMPSTGLVYDPDFSYETGLARFIERSNYNASENNPSELFIYNRTITEDSIHGLASRARNTIGKVKIDDSVLKYSCAYSEYDLNFLYVCHSIEKQEKFEVAYNSNSGISSLRELTVDMGSELGEFKYFVTPLPLTDITITGEGGVTYKGIMGILRVRGFFFTFEGNSKVIQQINNKIFSVVKTPEEKTPNEVVADLELEG